MQLSVINQCSLKAVGELTSLPAHYGLIWSLIIQITHSSDLGQRFINLNGRWSLLCQSILFCAKDLFVSSNRCYLLFISFLICIYLTGNLNHDICIFFPLSWDLWPKVPDYRNTNICASSNCCMLTGFQNSTFMSIITVHNCNWLSPSHKTLSRLSLLSVWGFMQRGELLCVGVSAYTLCVIMRAIMA